MGHRGHLLHQSLLCMFEIFYSKFLKSRPWEHHLISQIYSSQSKNGTVIYYHTAYQTLTIYTKQECKRYDRLFCDWQEITPHFKRFILKLFFAFVFLQNLHLCHPNLPPFFCTSNYLLVPSSTSSQPEFSKTSPYLFYSFSRSLSTLKPTVVSLMPSLNHQMVFFFLLF